MKNFRERKPDQRHHGKMTDDADEHAARRFRHAREIVQAHLRAHAEHDHLDGDKHDPLVLHVEIADVKKLHRINRRRRDHGDNPRGELVAAKIFSEAQGNRQRDGEEEQDGLPEFRLISLSQAGIIPNQPASSKFAQCVNLLPDGRILSNFIWESRCICVHNTVAR